MLESPLRPQRSRRIEGLSLLLAEICRPKAPADLGDGPLDFLLLLLLPEGEAPLYLCLVGATILLNVVRAKREGGVVADGLGTYRG